MTILIVAIVVLLLLIITIASLYFYQVAIARTTKEFLNDNPDLQSSELPEAANVFINEAREWWNSQNFEYWEMDSDDGIHLQAYYLAACEHSDKTAIIAHGYTGNAIEMSSFAKLYYEQLGYNVLLPDGRAHGRSGGKYIGFGWPERKDYQKWIQRAIEVNGADTQIVLHGVSMGGATVMMTSGERLPVNVKAVVEDCGYTSVKDELSFQLKRMYHLPTFPILHATSLLTKLRAGYFFGEASALKQVRKSHTPTLFIHGDNDTFVPTEMVHIVYENSPVEKGLYIVPGAGHAEAYRVNPEKYESVVADFIGRFVK
ncbi:alpha/beta hydrolase [Paenibacillus sp. D2_2]|uniref:alpha/beta hydrolase n=1 Tax=Paenibacillus sp. D2_2 TaxID=3073092 RepID=UPI00281522E7|nr:alpha/beta hydrolase [Paenibacillus sp. D2_2]WMT38883.1 alpha/beta hydrolase [Paenibacillus sp. D2_2]